MDMDDHHNPSSSSSLLSFKFSPPEREREWLGGNYYGGEGTDECIYVSLTTTFTHPFVFNPSFLPPPSLLHCNIILSRPQPTVTRARTDTAHSIMVTATRSAWSWRVVFVSVAAVAAVRLVAGQRVRRPELVPAMFVFGDSLIDNGNNNNLPSLAKANYFPYGIDFNGGPTGRFSNGYTMVDEIAELLGLPLIPAYSEASGQQLLHGVNYASAAAGILDITGRNFVGRIPFNQQITNFQSTLDQITDNLGADDVARAISQCLFFVGMGSNDYLNNYLMPNYDTKNQYNGQQFADLLVQQYTRQLTTLYNLGARKFVLTGIGQMGCIPSILAQNAAGLCSEAVNRLVQPFNANVKMMINNLNANLPGARFIYIDVARMFQDILTNGRSYGFSVVNRGCCGIGRNRGQITCLPFQTPCPNREQYVFWDAFHPTEAVNVIMGRKAFNGDRSVVYPINIEQLANL